MIPQLFKNLSPRQVEQLATCPPQVGGMFPNILLAFIFAPRTAGGASGALALHPYVPTGPNHVEFVNLIFAEKDAPEDVTSDLLQKSHQQTRTSGTIEPDNPATWPPLMRNPRGAVTRLA